MFEPLKKLLVFRWILPLLFIAAAHAQQYKGQTLVKASLVADTSAIVPGQTFVVGLLLETAPNWHTYWEYAGDAGIATSLNWTLPEGFAAGPIQWPLPERIAEPGGIDVYAYGEKVLLLTTIVVPKDLKDKQITLRAKAAWLVCEEICIPGSAQLELTLPVDSSATKQNQELFAEFQNLLPSAEAPPYALSWKTSGDNLTLTASGLAGVSKIDIFPLPTKNQEVSHPEGGTVKNGSATVTLSAKGALRGVLVADTTSGRKGWYVSSTEKSSGAPAAVAAPTFSAPQISLLTALFYGFIGGLILNLMPCVLPVISLKIFGFVRQAGDEPGKIFRHGLSFFAGILAFFFALAVVVIALKSAGHDVTWGSQFQNPWFNFSIAVLVFAFALNLFGVYEIALPGRAANALDGASSGVGYGGSFAQGLFATLLATPCTAPFLGLALGFAFAQSASLILATFGAVALGMGSPYLLLSARPGWMKILPRPGAWMERVRQFMGFPLIATLLWLLYILGNQTGLDAVIRISSFLLCVGLACWLYGAFCGPFSAPRSRVVSLVLILLILIGGGRYFLRGVFASKPSAAQSEAVSGDGIAWQPFSQVALEKLIAEKKTVFVDFTADWCLSCKANERLSINVPSVREALKKDGVVALKADWTNANPEITAALKKFGRVGVPFYVVYPGGRADQPIILPELLTSQIVLDALKKATE
ncbi:thioredoxin family protein [soil metagenome]